MFRDSVLPILKTIVPRESAIGRRMFRIAGMGESLVEEAVGAQLLELPGLELGYCARPGEMDLRLIGEASILDQAERIISDKLGPAIFSTDGSDLEEAVVKLLTAHEADPGRRRIVHRRLSRPSESRTCPVLPLFCSRVSHVFQPGESAMLGIDPGLIAEAGAVSEKVAQAMAEGARVHANADFALPRPESPDLVAERKRNRSAPFSLRWRPRARHESRSVFSRRSTDVQGADDADRFGNATTAARVGGSCAPPRDKGNAGASIPHRAKQRSIAFRLGAIVAGAPTPLRTACLRIDAHGRADLHVRIKLGGGRLRHADAAVRSRIARQNPDVHTHAFARQTHEPFHGGSDEMSSARG